MQAEDTSTSAQKRREWYRTTYLRSQHWRELRQRALENAGRRCQLCNSPKQLDVHHRTYERLGEELLSDVTVLCRACHTKFHAPAPQRKRSNGKAQRKKAQMISRSTALPAEDQMRALRILAKEGPMTLQLLALRSGLSQKIVSGLLHFFTGRQMVRKKGSEWRVTERGYQTAMEWADPLRTDTAGL